MTLKFNLMLTNENSFNIMLENTQCLLVKKKLLRREKKKKSLLKIERHLIKAIKQKRTNRK